MKSILSVEIKEQYSNGNKLFENAYLENNLLEGLDLSGIQFRNCKFMFSSFAFTNLAGAKFINCQFFFQSFFGANLTKAVFDNCKIEVTRFDNAVFDETTFRKCDLSYLAMIGVNRAGVNFFDSTQFKIVFDLSEITEDDLMKAVGMVSGQIESLGFELKTHLKKVVERYSGELGHVMKSDSAKTDDQKTGYTGSKNAYAAFSNIFDGLLNPYGNPENYKFKSGYEKKDNYRK
jgi:hypothetical protein